MRADPVRRLLLPIVASIAAVAVVTAAIALLDNHVPVLSLGVLYVFAVLPVAVVWGLWFALPLAVGCMLAFNFFFLPPTHTFSLREGENWFALAVFSATAIVVSELAASARRRAATAEQRERESAVLAELATELLRGREIDEELDEIGSSAAAVLGVPEATIELGTSAGPGHPLEAAGRHVGTLRTPPGAEVDPAVGSRFLPALAALLAVAAEREALEMLRRSDLVKTALLRAVSHDLRSPLTGIRTAVGALRSERLELTELDRRELLETIDVDSERLARLVADLLDLSRLEAGAAAPERELWALNDVARGAVDAVGESRHVGVSGESPVVRVDAAQVQRALANLIENALKFSPGAVEVHVATAGADAVVRVVDHGPGIAESDLERVFEPFYRGTGDERAGVGLGLAIARGFAEANGGRVWAESRPGAGATFVLALPVAEVPAELPA